ncbi:DUF4430 domain-containing protein [Metabacillus sediminilitoris]|uniref:DUF4430 domain-containing protein n=1 Tax=Metabacillus sediminilitoris TaxID=2567941 RepID=A0A4V3WFN4_9BACI|nr:DUF4430 domain-containing protein [Metabacillus sediminilitoris]QGQ47963.1 DUF4430 domain-containing protein [Metabacillus sediminilitoris]THF80923.1 DUF4430 domain-containing protein [Metabacillus sediminilitoris]
MKKFNIMLIAFIASLLFLTACEKDEVVPAAETAKKEETTTDQATADKQTEQEKKNTSEEQENEKAQSKDAASTVQSTTVNSTSSEKNTNDTSEKTENEEKTDAPSTNRTIENKPANHTTTQSAAKPVEKETNQTTTTSKSQSSTVTKSIPAQKPVEKEAEKPKEPQTQPPKKKEIKETVTIAVIGDSEKGTILSSTKVEITAGNTVLDVTQSILKQKGIPISVTGNGSTAYVEGIANLFEFDRGPLSGWTAKRNGITIGRSSDVIEVKNGDTIQWIYTTNYKEDSK